MDLSAFKAKIAGFDMSGNAIYSGKESIKDPTSGIYISTTGVGMGDGSLSGKTKRLCRLMQMAALSLLVRIHHLISIP